MVRASWQRAWQDRVGPEGLPPMEFTPEALEAHRSSHPLARAIDLIRTLLLPGSA